MPPWCYLNNFLFFSERFPCFLESWVGNHCYGSLKKHCMGGTNKTELAALPLALHLLFLSHHCLKLTQAKNWDVYFQTAMSHLKIVNYLYAYLYFQYDSNKYQCYPQCYPQCYFGLKEFFIYPNQCLVSMVGHCCISRRDATQADAFYCHCFIDFKDYTVTI